MSYNPLLCLRYYGIHNWFTKSCIALQSTFRCCLRLICMHVNVQLAIRASIEVLWYMQYLTDCHLWFQVCVRGDYTLEILINSYSNPTDQAVRWNGGCCDDVQCERVDRCENQFHFTARPLPTSDRHIGSAVIPSTHTGYHDSEVENLHVSIESSGQWQVAKLYINNVNLL